MARFLAGQWHRQQDYEGLHHAKMSLSRHVSADGISIISCTNEAPNQRRSHLRIAGVQREKCGEQKHGNRGDVARELSV